MSSDLYTVYAAIYDAAFDWDVSDQVSAICGLSGVDAGRLLEPMCGSGRLCRAFARQGFHVIGIDESEEMLALAEAHFAREGLRGEWLKADATSFALDEACDLAVCPINSLQHLPSVSAMGAHLQCMAQNLYSNSSYWVQLDLSEGDSTGAVEEWEFEYLGETLRCEWAASAPHDGFETHVSRFVFPDGRVVEEEHDMKVWRYADWAALIDASAFELSGAYRGDDFEPIPIGPELEGLHVIWQQLVKVR